MDRPGKDPELGFFLIFSAVLVVLLSLEIILAPRVVPQFVIYRYTRLLLILLCVVATLLLHRFPSWRQAVRIGFLLLCFGLFFLDLLYFRPRIYAWNTLISLFIFLNFFGVAAVTVYYGFRAPWPMALLSLSLAIVYQVLLYGKMTGFPLIFPFLTIFISCTLTIISFLLKVLLFAKQEQQRLHSQEKALNRQLTVARGKLMEQEKLFSLSTLTAGIAHELNNPINYLSGNLSFLEEHIRYLLDRQPEEDLQIEEVRKLASVRSDLKEMMGEYKTGFDTVTAVIRNMKKIYSREGNTKIETNLAEVLDKTIYFFEISHRGKSYSLTNSCPRQITARVNPNDFYVVFSNLLTNAFEAIEEDGEITISYESADNHHNITFYDNGCGISAEAMQSIFDPFYTRKRSYSMGLGLSLCKAILTDHKGDIQVRSVPGSHTRITIRIPGDKK